MEFALIGDNFGVRQNVPSVKLSTAFVSALSSGVTYRDGAIRRVPGRGLDFLDAEGASVQTPDGATIIHWHFHTTPAGVQYCFAYTSKHVYVWDSTNLEWDLMFTCSVACTHWSSASFKDKVVSTNSIDKVQVWDEDTPGTAFANMGSDDGIDIGGSYLTAAGHVRVYESYLHFLDVVEGGTRYRYRDAWSSRNDDTDFDRTGSGDCGSHDLEASLMIKGAAVYTAGSASLFVIFTNKNVTAGALVEDTIVFRYDEISGSCGTIAPDSIVNDPAGNVYYLGTDWQIHRLFDLDDISIAISPTLRGLSRALTPYVRSAYIESLKQMWWAIPKDNSSSGNDKVIALNMETGGWEFVGDYAVASFGRYTQQSSLAIDDVDVLIDEYDILIDSVENAEGFSYQVVANYSGYAYSVATSVTDAGNAFTGSAVFATDLSNGRSLRYYKRTEGAYVWCEAEDVSTYEISLAVRGDDESSFVSVGSMSLAASRELIEAWIPFDVRAKNFEFQISGSNPFAFVAMIVVYSEDGE